jgi:hypothetical protein
LMRLAADAVGERGERQPRSGHDGVSSCSRLDN